MGFVVATNRGVLGKHAAGEWNEGTNQSCHSSHRSPFRGRLAFGFLEPVLGFTREQVIRNFAFGELEVEPSHEVLDCRRRPRSDRDKIRGRSGKLTLWLRNGLTGDWNGQGVDTESAEDEGGEKGFGEHDDRECCGEE